MTDLAGAISAIKTHIRDVEVDNSFPFRNSSDQVRGIHFTTDPPVTGSKRFPWIYLRTENASPVDNESESPLQYVDIVLELTDDITPGDHGEGQFLGKHGKTGIEKIRAAIISATEQIGPSDTPPISPGMSLSDGGGAPISQGKEVTITLRYEALLEV